MSKQTLQVKITQAPEDKKFWLANGGVLSTIEELRDALKNMDAQTFKHHVNANKNDFANWIKDVFQEKKLATSIKKLKTKESIYKKIDSFLK